MLGMIVMGVYDLEHLPQGDPRRLLYGMDYLGSLCSVDGETQLSNGSYGYRKYDVTSLEYGYYLPSGALVCVNACASVDDASRFICTYELQEELDAYLRDGDVDQYWKKGLQGVLAYSCNFHWATTEFLSYCVFDGVPDVTAAVAESAPMDRPSPFPTVPRESPTSSMVPTSAPVRKPTRAPVPAPTSRPTTSDRTTFVPSAAPSFDSPVPCTQSLDRSYCDDLVGVNATPASAHLYCYSFFCPDCPLPGACDFACGFCETRAPTRSRAVDAEPEEESDVYEEIMADVLTLASEILIFGFGVALAFGRVGNLWVIRSRLSRERLFLVISLSSLQEVSRTLKRAFPLVSCGTERSSRVEVLTSDYVP